MRTYFRRCDTHVYRARIVSGETLLCWAHIEFFKGCWMVTMIRTDEAHRRKGYASQIVRDAQKRFPGLKAAGIVEEARGFWAKMNVVEGLPSGRKSA